MANEYEIKKQICDIGKRIYDRGMVAANDGNISVKISDNEFLCTPTGVSKGFMTPEYICKVDKEGKLIQANGNFRPSSEIKMHMRVYKCRPDVGSVVHAHPSYSDLMNVVNKGVEEGETPVVNSRYSIVMATSKRARKIVSGAEPQVNPNG